jgi:hypothetical protein
VSAETPRTEVLDQNLSGRSNVLVLLDQRQPVLQDLVVAIEEAQTVGVEAANLLGQVLLDILHGCLVADLDSGRQFLDRFLRS